MNKMLLAMLCAVAFSGCHINTTAPTQAQQAQQVANDQSDSSADDSSNDTSSSDDSKPQTQWVIDLRVPGTGSLIHEYTSQGDVNYDKDVKEYEFVDSDNGKTVYVNNTWLITMREK